MPSPGPLPALQSLQLGPGGDKATEAAWRGARPAPCQLRAANQLLVGRGTGAAPETCAARTKAGQRLPPNSLWSKELEQHQKPALTEPWHSSGCTPWAPAILRGRTGPLAHQQPQKQAAIQTPRRARGRHVTPALIPRCKQVQRANSPPHIPPAPGPEGCPTPAAPPLPSPGGRDDRHRAALKPPEPLTQPSDLYHQPPTRNSPDSASELVARLRAAGGRSVRRGQRGARAGPSRRTASHAIFAGRPAPGRCLTAAGGAAISSRRGGRGQGTELVRRGERGCLGLSAACGWRDEGREAPGTCSKAPVAAPSLGRQGVTWPPSARAARLTKSKRFEPAVQQTLGVY